MSEQQQCIDCHETAPRTTTNYTLISAQHGWRVTKTRGPDGSIVVEWRCATCWQRRKDATPKKSASSEQDSKQKFSRVTRKLVEGRWEPPPR
jgi:hypothetical protein